MIRKFLVAGLFAVALAPGAALAAYPEKPVNYIIAFNPGGESDIAARFQQTYWEKLTAQQLVIQYQAGAGGAQAWSQLNKMEGDGYTIMGTNLPHTVLQPLEKAVGYQADDLTHVYFFHYTPDAIFVPANSQFKSLKDLVDYAKKNPGMVTFSGSGSNTSNHLAQQRFDEMAGTKTTYVPFSGTAPAMTAVLGSQVMAGFNYSTSAINAGDKVRVLAVASEERMPNFPDTPTFRELGFDLVGGAYRGIAVPKSTPEERRKEVSAVIDKINKDPGFIKQMQDAGFVLTNIGYDQMDKFMAERKKFYTDIATKMGIVKK